MSDESPAPGVVSGFRGPYADGPPPDALRIDAPPLDRFGPGEVARAVLIGLAIVGRVLLAVLRHLPSATRNRGRDLPRVASEGLVDAFEWLGPTFVKLGQLIASSPGVFPAPLADACLRTLDEVPPFSSERARALVEEDLGRPVSQLFARFDDRPLSAASIAQVHACRLADGREAVLKIQRPDIADRMNTDLRILHLIARLLGRTEVGARANVVAVIEDLHRVTNEELNAALEAHRQHRFRENIGAYGDNEWITAPEVFWNYCGPHVICMERMTGHPMDAFEDLRALGVDGELILRRGVKVWMEAALVHGPFHGDVHAGNLWVLEDGRASYLDFGIMGELPADWRDALRDIQYTAMIDGDYSRVVRHYKKLGVLPADVGDDEQVGLQLKMMVEPMLDQTVGEVSLGELLRQNLEMAEQFGATSPRELVLITKQLLYFERYAKELAPDYNMARDLYLLKNIFPDEVAAAAAERGIELPA